MPRTVAELLIDTLEDLGVTHVFGVVGDALNPVTDAIRRSDQLTWVGCRHEEVAAYAAGAQAQLTGRLGVCMGTVGPGSVHLLSGLFDAQKSHAPVLAIAGQVPLEELGSDFFQEVDNDAVFAPVAEFSRTVTSASQAPRMIEQAIQSAMTRPGVAVLSMPADVGSATVEDDSAVHAFWADPPTLPGVKDLDRAARLIDEADRVTLLVGRGARGARADVLRLADHLGAPMVVALQAKQGFDHDNPFQIGQSGLLGNPASAHAFKHTDLLLMLGTDFPYREFLPEHATTIQLDKRAEHLGRRTKVDLGLVGHAEPTVRELLARVRPKIDRSHLDGSVKKYESWKARQAKIAAPGFADTIAGKVLSAGDNREGRIRPEALAATIDAQAAPDAIFTSDTGMSTVWLARFVHLQESQRLLGSYNYGSMANAMPQAIGAQLLDTHRQVIAFCGDGGLSMLLGDLLTIVSERLPVKVVVFNNGRLGMVKLEQEQAGLPEFGTELDNPNFAEVGRAIGLHGIRVEDPAGLDAAVAEALTHPGPVLLDVV
ncbi:MAG: thiamine pyrophosphate-binding protein, partial [Patulibacter sp.]|nr:thiamine pyrophosphate-binding protein [Patulibacter sp.]